MDTPTIIICLLIGIIQIILIFAVIRTSENTKEMENILIKMSKDLSDISKSIYNPSQEKFFDPNSKTENQFNSKSDSPQIKKFVHRYRGENGEWIYTEKSSKLKDESESKNDFDGLSKAMKE